VVWPVLAGWDVRLLVRGRAFDQVAFVLGLLSVLVIEDEVAGDFTAAFLDLLVEAGGAASVHIEAGLEAVYHGKQHVDGAGGIGRSGDTLHSAALVQVKDSRAGGEDAPVDGECERGMLRIGEAGGRLGQHRNGPLRRGRLGGEDLRCRCAAHEYQTQQHGES